MLALKIFVTAVRGGMVAKPLSDEDAEGVYSHTEVSGTCFAFLPPQTIGTWVADEIQHRHSQSELLEENRAWLAITEEWEMLPPFLQNMPPGLWTTGPTDVGLITTATPFVLTPKSDFRLRVRQYPLKREAQEGIRPVIKDLLKAGVLRQCPDSPCNTAIYPVKKADGSNWRMIQDLRPVNSSVIN